MTGRQAAISARSLTWGNRAGARVQAALACAAAGLLLAGCTALGGGSSPAPTTPTPGATASSPAPAPSTSAPPARPAAMERQDVEGAIAAAQYFLELYPYAYNTGDLTEWRAMSHPDCIFCASVVENVEELHAAGGYETGGRFRFEAVSAQEPLPGNAFFGVDFTLTQEAGTRYNISGDIVEQGPETTLALFTAVDRSADGWLMRAVSVETQS